MKTSTVSIRLIKKITGAFLLLILLIGISYIFITYYFTHKFFEETSQKLNAEVASHVINEKFINESPFLADGSVNKDLFGDLMNDMMAVNRGIEVYLLSANGDVLYSVVLDHSGDKKTSATVDIAPLEEFIASKGNKYILGQDPRNPEQKKIFSADRFEINGREGFIYVILAGQKFEEATNTLVGSYFLQLGIGASIATLFFAGLIGVIVIWYLTKNLREIIDTVRRFKEGDMEARIQNADTKDLSILTETFNDMANTLVANINDLKSVEMLRRELIANVSHDLRTPLAITKGYIETLQIKKSQLSEEEVEKYLNIVNNSIGKLQKLIDQLFEYSKLEAKQIEPQKEPFSLSDLAHDVFEKYQQLAEQKKIKLHLNIEPNLPQVFGDISLVERVLQNLIDNALKFTPDEGNISINMRAFEKSVSIAIKDTGTGIGENEIEEIFERYKQAKSEPKKAKEGAGLGLAIAKKIIELHDSAIKVVSKPNFGTTFEFQLPMATGLKY
ncbi:sensor histidine kinase [Roseivirga sp.]|uniref:sensor histidine kinase n=1 Tax=Roseivirga sp. TaxID=1964215 RepID=UPI003B51AB4D